MSEDPSTPASNAPPGQTTGLMYMAVSAFFFSIMGLLVKVAGQRLPSQEIVFFRSLLVLVFAYAMARRGGVDVWGNDKRWLVARGLTGFVGLSCFYYGVTHLPLAAATVIMYSNPIFTAVFAAIFLREALTRVDVAGVVFSLVGVVLIAQPSFVFGGSSRLDLPSVAVALTGSIFAAISYVIVRKLRQTEPPLVVVFYFPLIATPAAIPTALPDAVVPTWVEAAVLAGIGLVTLVAQIALTRGLHLEQAGRATAVSYLQVVFAFVWGIVFFGEFPTVWSALGAVLIVGSAIAIAWRQQHNRPAHRTDAHD